MEKLWLHARSPGKKVWPALADALVKKRFDEIWYIMLSHFIIKVTQLSRIDAEIDFEDLVQFRETVAKTDLNFAIVYNNSITAFLKR